MANYPTSLAEVVQIYPPECFQIQPWKAWGNLVLNLLILMVSYVGLLVAPWYGVPLFWVLCGTALHGLFVLAHDCGHYTFARQRWVNEVVGTLLTLPVIYPFFDWCIQHNRHHAKTVKLGREFWAQLRDINRGRADTNWQPLRPEVYGALKPRVRWMYRFLRTYGWWLGSIHNWWNDLWSKEEIPAPYQKKLILARWLCALTFLALFIGLTSTVGIWGFVKLWGVPWIIFHGWLGTFSLLHHTDPQTLWHPQEEWDPIYAQLQATIHCNYPRWIEFLNHDVNYHISHHITAAIPFYHLRLAHTTLQHNYGPYLKEKDFSWSTLQVILQHCHLYNPVSHGYQSFKDFEGTVTPPTPDAL